MTSGTEINGILVVDKPAGITSHDVVDRVRRLFRTRRVGHTGTLDPGATGVLVICLGKATRLANYLASASKQYTADVVFGLRTDTMDASGNTLSDEDASQLSEARVRSLLPAFRGKILQTPPMVSARHHQGRRLYELAREGVTVEREAREVEITDLDLDEFTSGRHPTARIQITCSTGTYIRVLADDMGRAAGTGAIMQTLRRNWVGADLGTAFTLQEAHTLEELDRLVGLDELCAALIPLSESLRALPRFHLQPEALRRLRQGQTVAASEATEESSLFAGTTLAAIVDDAGELCAVVSQDEQSLRPIKVLSPQ